MSLSLCATVMTEINYRSFSLDCFTTSPLDSGASGDLEVITVFVLFAFCISPPAAGRHSPELVVGVSHLVRSQFGHQDFDDSDENEEVDLEKRGESKMSTVQMTGEAEATWDAVSTRAGRFTLAHEHSRREEQTLCELAVILSRTFSADRSHQSLRLSSLRGSKFGNVHILSWQRCACVCNSVVGWHML